MTMKQRRNVITAAALMAAMAGAPALAQSTGSSRQDRQQKQSASQEKTTGGRETPRRSGEDRAARDRGERSGRWSPEAVTIIGYDLDRDGRTDAWYEVTTYEYDRMRQDQRRAEGRPMPGRVMGRAYDERRAQAMNRGPDRRWSPDSHRGRPSMQQRGYDRPAQPARPALQRFAGVLEDVKSFTFANDDRKHLVGKLRLNSGETVPVHFGTENSLDADLSKGDRITVIGDAGRLNDRRIIIARDVVDNGGRHAIRRMSDGDLRRCSGEVVAVAPVKLNDGSESLLVDIRANDGRFRTVALGSREQLGKAGVTIKEGATVHVLGQMASVTGNPVILADRVTAAGKTARVSPSRQKLMSADDFSQVFTRLDNRRGDAEE